MRFRFHALFDRLQSLLLISFTITLPVRLPEDAAQAPLEDPLLRE